MLSETLSKVYFSNSLLAYLVALGLFVAVFLLSALFQKIVLVKVKQLVKKTSVQFDDVIFDLIASIRPSLYVIFGLWVAIKSLTISSGILVFVDALLIFAIVYSVVKAIRILVEYIAHARLDKDDPSTDSVISLLVTLIRFVLWAIGGVLVLSNLGIDVTSLIAGLGIGGIAIALAAQKILGDLFSSFSIYFDKPFAPGDFIVTDKVEGVVEKIGIKTTRIRALTGEEVVVSNEDLTNSIIHNFRKLKTRRVVLPIGVVYETPKETLKLIPSLVEKVISSVENARFDRAHLKTFGDSALMYEVVYYVLSSDYETYMNVNQEIHHGIFDRFEENKIEFAYPTMKQFVVKTDS